MKERPILFSTPMVQAILNGTKTQTRRAIKAPRIKGAIGFVVASDYTGRKYPIAIDEHESHLGDDLGFQCPYGKPGDVLWVRETWCYSEDEFGDHSSNTKGDIFGRFLYKANGDSPHNKWKPSIHMPKEACRIKLLIKEVRIERLCTIKDEDAKAEGIRRYYDDITKSWRYKDYISDASGYGDPDHDFPCVHDPKQSFHTLWDSINGGGDYRWANNPWVWVVTFEVI